MGTPPETTSPDPMALWRRVLEDPQLQDLSYKFETNARGQIVLSPRSIKCSFVQVQVADLVKRHLPEGIRAVEFAVLTDDGVKTPVMPELIAEIGWLVDDHTSEVLYDRKELYFAGGAEEVWICSLEGEIAFFEPEGTLQRSKLAPEMPERLS